MKHATTETSLLVTFWLTNHHLFPGWRREEIEKIDSTRAGPERKAALVGLLEQESYLIASIERHRIKANKENKESSIKKFLDTVRSLCMYICMYLFPTIKIYKLL